MENHIFIILKQKQTLKYSDQELEKLQIENYLKSAAEFFSLAGLKTKKNSEIAQMLGLSKRTVENQLYRALKIIKKILKEKI